jgi:DNA repair exonuclease SbcCD nuclease subunit
VKIAITTDTHYGYNEKTHRIHQKFLTKLAESCANEKVDIVIHCGDWIACDQHQLPRTWKMFRSYLGDLPILAVLGNHDFWDREGVVTSIRKRSRIKHPAGLSLQALQRLHLEWASESNIHLLQNNHFVNLAQDAAIFGFNGWYAQPNAPTNDASNMAKMYESCPTMTYFSYQAGKDFDIMLYTAENLNFSKKICVTHFPPYSKNASYLPYCANPRYLDFITQNFDLLLVGHSHQQEDWINEVDILDPVIGNLITYKCRVVNAGTNFDSFSGGYNKPNFKIIEI